MSQFDDYHQKAWALAHQAAKALKRVITLVGG